jgi:hypothetical protein
MDIALFKDVLDALDRIGGWLKSASSLPKKERDEYIKVLDDTYTAIDAAFVLVITRLRDILDPVHADEFYYEVRNLGNTQEWLDTERKVRLCASLRATRIEMDKIKKRLSGKVSINDWGDLERSIDLLLMDEAQIAKYLSDRLDSLAQNPSHTNVEGVMESLKEDRRKLIKQQTEIYKYF